MARATVLIVEDSPDIAQPLADAFRFSDFSVLLAPNAAQALQLAHERRPDVILMDIQLPDMNGLAVAETLKQDPATRAIPIIAMTAYDIDAPQVKTITRACVGYVQKPIRPREIINLAEAVLKLPGPEPKARGTKAPPPPRPR
jgi:two-component system cell cycle response regulator DivK